MATAAVEDDRGQAPAASTEEPIDDRMQANNQDDDTRSMTSQEEALMELLGLDASAPGEIGEAVDDESMAKPQQQQQQQDLVQRITLPPNNHRHFHPPDDCWAYEFPNMLSPEECHELIQLAAGNKNSNSTSSSSSFQYITEALHTTPDGQQLAVQLDNPNHHKLSVFHHSKWVDLLWNRIQQRLLWGKDGTSLIAPYLQREGKNMPPPTALNPRLRVLKYDADDQDDFAPHYDATTRIETSGISLWTVLLYLNTGGGVDFAGGETYFINALDPDRSPMKQTPQAGTVVIFEHDLYHAGHALEWGTKYVLRTDLMFDISEEEWGRRAKMAAERLEAVGDGDDGTTKQVTIPRTVLELVEAEWTSESDQAILQEALGALGVLDTSIESFCTPGRFALLLMLQDVLSGSDMSQRLVERAFDCLEQSKK